MNKRSTSARVPVSGLGIVSPGAIGREAFATLLDAGHSAIAPVTRFDTTGLSAKSAGLLEGFVAKNYVPAMKLRRMNTLSRLAVAATRMALDDAGLTRLALPSSAVGVSIGTAFGPVQTSAEYLKEYVEKGAALAPPQLFAESVANAPGSHIAIEHDFQGFNLTFTQRESSALTAAMYAASQIAHGALEGAIVGGVEEMNEIIYAVLDRIGALARMSNGLPEACRPFDARRNGVVVGEGGAVLILAPGETVYGYFAGFGIATDTTASISGWGEDAAAVVRAMRTAIDDAGLAVEDVDAVFASANGSLHGDALEARAIGCLFGERVPPVVATKGIFGEYSAAGALQLCAAFLALKEQKIPPSAGFEIAEPGMVFAPETSGRSLALRHVLVNSLSAGGGIVSALLTHDA